MPGPPGSRYGYWPRRLGAAVLVTLVLVVGAVLVSSATHSSSPRDRSSTAGSRAVDASTSAPSATTSTSAPPSVARGPRGSGQAVTFAFGGDVQFPDAVDSEGGAPPPGAETLAAKLAADPTHVLDPIAPVLSKADLAMVNLETAITDRGEPVAGKNYHFRTSAAAFTALKAAGVDVVNMANNHALDYGPVGLQDTFAAIAKAKLPVIGIGYDAAEAYRPYRAVVKGQRIAIFSALDWLEPALIPAWTATDSQPGVAFAIDRTRLVAAITAVRPQVDTLVVFLHWGTEETYCASPEQEDLAKTLLAAGADVVVGSHAHRVFGAGKIGPSLVAYGLGNLVYWREDGESGRSGILQVTVTGREVDAYSWVPARITGGIPVPESGAAATADVAEWDHRRACSGLSP